MEEVAAKARKETKLVFTSLAHHVTRDLIKESLEHTPLNSSAGIDGIDVRTARETFDQWIGEMETSVHRKSYKAPAVRRVWIPKPGKTEKRPIGVPIVANHVA